MLNSGKKFRALRANKNNILTLVLSEKKILNETKNHNPPPPLKLNGRSLRLYCHVFVRFIRSIKKHCGVDRYVKKIYKKKVLIITVYLLM